MSKPPMSGLTYYRATGPIAKSDFVRDASGKEVQRPASLLEKLVWRATGNAPIPPKRGRGRPRKGGAV